MMLLGVFKSYQLYSEEAQNKGFHIPSVVEFSTFDLFSFGKKCISFSLKKNVLDCHKFENTV